MLRSAAVQLRAVMKKAKVVGFDGSNNPLVSIVGEGKERISVKTADNIRKSSLSFGEVVELQHDDSSGWILTATTKPSQQQSLPPMSRREAESRYKQVVRGANNVGMYAWVSRRVRAAKKR
eukprot:TRINITY_DN36856_c0_g1_i1.p1 TRINITY_DN36856_c0_g1~~TRINITY_DN36856_c0_g1_i1.p1  ORF type:complete len:121 (+),score=14.05 TRINITY_DN36856_c0_g1_i1:49-411(+)